MNAEQKKRFGRYLQESGGVLRLAPAWVTRTILPPGRRLKLDVRDLYPRGLASGAVCERWMASTGMVDNGETTGELEGMSFIVYKTANGVEKVLLKDAIEEFGDGIIGKQQMEQSGGLTAFAKFYDFSIPIHNHVHLREKEAAAVGAPPKPEAYYFPVELNAYDYDGAYTYFGIDPHLTKEEFQAYFHDWGMADNGILEVSRAYRLKLGTGWDIPAGILHAPGSLVTYEPQYMSDTSLFMQSVNHEKPTEKSLLTNYLPADKKDDLEYLAECLDWEANTDLDFKAHHYHEPVPVRDINQMEQDGYYEEWIVYGSREFCAKRLIIAPGRNAVITDAASYGLIMMQGYGTINGYPLETPACIRYNQLTCDEYYITKDAAERGVHIENRSDNAELVMLKHFGRGNSDADQFV